MLFAFDEWRTHQKASVYPLLSIGIPPRIVNCSVLASLYGVDIQAALIHLLRLSLEDGILTELACPGTSVLDLNLAKWGKC